MTATSFGTARESGRQQRLPSRRERPAGSDGAEDAGPRLERAADGQLVGFRDGKPAPLRVVRCFPWTEPGRFVSLRDEKDQEYALVRDAADLHGASREAFEAALAEAGFLFEIVRIESAEEVYEIRHWVVETAQGPRTFQTKLDDWPRELPSGGFLVRDVNGDLYCVAPGERLDARSRRILWALAE
ncbi:MAG: DUF1854 domain-containing protein [Planctomycetota bacterium]|nr:DUF1854 domain-containing protein [Planctomycetota bacterium]